MATELSGWLPPRCAVLCGAVQRWARAERMHRAASLLCEPHDYCNDKHTGRAAVPSRREGPPEESHLPCYVKTRCSLSPVLHLPLVLSVEMVLTLLALVDVLGAVDAAVARRTTAGVGAVDRGRVTDGVSVARVRGASVVQMAQQTCNNTVLRVSFLQIKIVLVGKCGGEGQCACAVRFSSVTGAWSGRP